MNLISKMLAVPAAVLALWAVTAQASTHDDIANIVSFLVSPEAAWVNGQVLRGNGGLV